MMLMATKRKTIMRSAQTESVQTRLESITAHAVRAVDPASLYGVAVRLLALAAVVEPADSDDLLDAAQRSYLAGAIADASGDLFSVIGAGPYEQ